MDLDRVVLGDCLEVLKTFPDASVDSIVTDPPYGLGNREPEVEEIVAYLQGADLDTGGDFMGKKWSVPSVAIWQECFRVLKPGGHLLAFGGTRTFDLISLGIRAAGFENRDTIAHDFGCPVLTWRHGMGFPKSLNIGKAVDALLATGRSNSTALSETEKTRPIVGRVRRIVSSGRKAEAGLTASGVKANMERFLNYEQADIPVTAPATLEAAEWEGWGTALKPSFEPVVVFRKPLGLQGFSAVIGSHLWKLHARLADLSSTSNPPDSYEELGSAPASVEQRSATQAVSSEVTGTSLSDKDLVSSLNIVSSWLDILSALSRHESTFTIETASSLTTDLRILSYSLSKITPENMPQALILNAGLSCIAEPVARMFDAVAMKLSAILASFAVECATGLEPHRPQDEGDRVRPTWEPILAFRKPVEGTVASNVLKHGTGGMNIDANRVRHSNPEDFAKHKDMVDRIKEKGGSMADSWKNSSDLSGAGEVKTAGRWPPNAVMTHADGCKKVGTKKVKNVGGCTSGENALRQDAGWNAHNNRPTEIKRERDESGNETVEAWDCVPGCPVRALDEQSGESKSTGGRIGNKDGGLIYGGGKGLAGAYRDGDPGFGDTGGASRFFPQFEGQVPPEAPFLYTGKANKREATLDGEVENNHPTKKPVALMQWLVRLVTPKKGICLDPFAGSGSTLVAAVEEGMHFIGIERDPAYHAIAEKRVGIVHAKEQSVQGQRDMFEMMMDLGDD